MHFAQRVNRIQPSPTLAMNARIKALVAAGQDIINLTVGEPDFDTPEHIKQAAIRALAEGFTKYTAVEGFPALKEAIIEKFSKENGLAFSASEILVSCGGKHAIYNLCMSLLEAGDEVIIPTPYWVSYPDIVQLCDATPVFATTSPNDGLKLTPASLRSKITPKTRLLILNSPSNPSGAVYTRLELQALAQVLLEHPSITVLTDDLYEHIYWAEEPFCNILQAEPRLKKQTVIVNGVSKAYAMTGWRIGYAAGPAPLIAEMGKIQSQNTSNPNSIAQKATIEALLGDQTQVRTMNQIFQTRYHLVRSYLERIPDVELTPAQGAFYAFPNLNQVMLRKKIPTDLALCEYLLEQGVSVMPGSVFGSPGYIRISYALSETQLTSAMERLVQALS